MLLLTMVAIGSIALFSSCDEDFNPVSGEVVDSFSVFGYVDAAADTQWIRIMPVRQSIEPIQDSIDAVVTLRELGGAAVEMQPRLFRFTNIVGDTVFAWNFWTDFDIKPDTGYELLIEQHNGEITKAIAYTPPETAPPYLTGAWLTINNAPNMVDIRLSWKVYHKKTGKTREFSYSHFAGAKSTQLPNTYQLTINPNLDFVKIGQELGYLSHDSLYAASLAGEVEVLETEIIAISAGPEWQGLFDLTREELALQSIENSNIVNGVGYFVGALGEKIPINVCPGDEGEMTVCQF